ncbi:MAG: protein kinase family protein [Actinomycetota bacterium]
MSTFISEPGTRLGGRYRLEDRVAAAGGWAAWKAIDEILARAVTVFTFEPGFPRVREVVTAARAAGRLTDARLTQVFDVEDDWDHAYIVMEWASGDSLDDLLAAGALEPGRGAQIVAEAAEALSVAHAAGLAHLCLLPGSLRWTPGGGVKIVGLGIDAALAGITAEDPAVADTRGLAKLLYASLTGLWPGSDCLTLPPAPLADGLARRPRQIRAGVPAALDDITCRALFQQDRKGGRALSTPRELAIELAAAIPPAPPPEAAPQRTAVRSRETGQTAGYGGYGPASQPPASWGGQLRPAAPRPRGSISRRSVAAVVMVLLVIGAAVLVGALAFRPGHSAAAPQSPKPSSHHSASPVAAQAVLQPVSAQGIAEPSDNAGLAIDSDPHTAWKTQFYVGSPVFGNLKKGSGLLLDIGKAERLSSVEIQFGPTAGANVSIEVGNDSSGQQSSFTTVAQQDNVPGGTTTFTAKSKATGRYVQIWFTRLPPEADGPPGRFGAEIFSVALKGSG